MTNVTPAASRQARIAASVASLLRQQSSHGSFAASPDFGEYGYCWLRDASFVSHALDVAGEHSAAARYHGWVVRTLTPLRDVLRDPAAVAPERRPPARFALDGSVVADGWPNYQTDGYGIWLWSLREHWRMAGVRDLGHQARAVITSTWRYLDATAGQPCFDVWEEHGDKLHVSTLGCVTAGLSAAADLLGEDRPAERATELRALITATSARLGWFPKWEGAEQPDASTLWLAAPLNVVPANDPAMSATIGVIADTLDLDGGGIRRYPADTYYGGGAWPVLTASLGLCRLAVGDIEAAKRSADWIEDRFDSGGRLAEQFGGERRDPPHYREWEERWGPPARDLLWSHAMYVELAAGIARKEHLR
jgi:GH15 family glucan-1,4-alpha-glucosidase